MRRQRDESANEVVGDHSVAADSGPADQVMIDAPGVSVRRAKKSKRGQGMRDTPSLAAAPSEIGQKASEAHIGYADLATLCADLKELQVRRRHLIRSKDRNRLALGSLVRRHLGWRMDLPEKEREKIRKDAAALIDRAAAGEVLDGTSEWLTEFAIDCEASCAPFDKRLALVEKQMIKLAEQLPAAAWVQSVKGFGMKTLGVIVGETGDLSRYDNPARIWKRLGLAPKDTYSQADNGAHLVPRQRRAQIWACLGDPLLKLNDGIYRAAYDTKKAELLKRAETEEFWQYKGKPHLMHIHKAAHRFMEKLAIKDLWRAWRGQSVLNPITGMPRQSHHWQPNRLLVRWAGHGRRDSHIAPASPAP